MEYKTLYGSTAGCVCGYCVRHHVHLTVKQLKGRKCCEKNCKHLMKMEQHEYWGKKSMAKSMRQARKAKMKEELAKYGK